MLRTRGTLGSPGAVLNDDWLGAITFQGHDGTQPIFGAKIQAEVDGTPGTNDMPTRLVFSTTSDGTSSLTERMRLDSSGNLTLYGGRLQLNTGVDSLIDWSIHSDADSFSVREREDSDLEAFRIADGGGDGQFSFTFRGNSTSFCTIGEDCTITTPRLRLTAVNDVGLTSTSHAFQIGATTGANVIIDNNEIMARNNGASEQLYLNASGNTALVVVGGGGLRVENLVSGGVSSTASGTLINTGSDIKLKKNITSISDSLNKVCKLNGVYYNWIDENELGSQTNIGLIAQDVLDVIPELVFQRRDNMYGVHYDQIGPVLINAIKELKQQLDAALTRITELESKIQT